MADFIQENLLHEKIHIKNKKYRFSIQVQVQRNEEHAKTTCSTYEICRQD